MNFLIILNLGKQNSVDCCSHVVQILKSRGCRCFVFGKYMDALKNLPVEEYVEERDFGSIDMVLTIGGVPNDNLGETPVKLGNLTIAITNP